MKHVHPIRRGEHLRAVTAADLGESQLSRYADSGYSKGGLKLLLWWLCLQMLAPRYSLQYLLSRVCSQMPDPSHSCPVIITITRIWEGKYSGTVVKDGKYIHLDITSGLVAHAVVKW